MLTLFKALLQIALLRQGPQSIPASKTLLMLVLAAHLGVGVLLALGSLSLVGAVLVALLGTVVMVAWMQLILAMKGLGARFLQGVTALAACEVIVGLVALPISYWFHGGGSEQGVVVLLSLGIFVWNIAVAGHVFQHTFDLAPRMGSFYAVAYIFVSLFISSLLG